MWAGRPARRLLQLLAGPLLPGVDGDRLMIPSLGGQAGVGPMMGQNAEKGSPLCPDEHGVN